MTTRSYQTVLFRIEADLAAGRLEIGGRLPGERTLAERYAVSRSSVREAIRVLEAMGLIRTATGSGPESGATLIADPAAPIGAAIRWHLTSRHLPVADIVATRVLIEAWALREAAIRRLSGGVDLGNARELLIAMEGRALSAAEFLALDTRFHVALAQLAGNSVIAAIMSAMREGIESYVTEAVRGLPDWPTMATLLRSQHAAMLEAVSDGRPELAATLVTEHIHGFYAATGVGQPALEGIAGAVRTPGTRRERSMGRHGVGGGEETSRRVAAIDCGTNSIRLLIADLTADRGILRLTDVHREMRVVRLGEGVDATGRLTTGALDRTWHALSDYTATLRAAGAVDIRMAATSATRDAANRSEFVDMVRTTLGQEPEVITGEEEAELSFRGAVGDLDPTTGPFLVVDIGGGSTELVVGSVTNGQIVIAGQLSLDIGCVRLTERILRSDPPTAAERQDADTLVRSMLTDGLDRLPVRSVRRLIPVSGTATTVAAAALRLTSYDPRRIHLATVSSRRVREVSTMLLGATRAHRAALGYMHPGRVDVIGAGALILSTLVSLVAKRTGPGFPDEITVSEHDILDGLALSLA